MPDPVVPTPPPPTKLRIPRPRLTLAFLRESVPFLRRLLGLIRPYRTRFLLGQLCGIGFALCNGTIPFLLQFVLRYALPETRVSQTAFAEHHADESLELLFLRVPLPSPEHMVLLACLAVPAVMILRGLFDYLNGYSMAWVSLRVLSDLRRRLFGHLTSQGLDFFGTQRAGMLISRVANDTRIAQGALSIISADLIKQPVAVVSGVVALFWMDPRFTLVSLVLFPTCILPVAIYGKRIRRASRLEEQQQGAMTVILQETFAGIRVIKSFARERFQNRQFDRLSAEQFRNSMRVRKASEIVGPLVEVVAAVGVGLALFYVHRTGLSLSRFFSLATGLFLLYNPAKQLSKLHLQIAKCRAASQEIFDLLEVRPTVQDRPDAVALPGRARGEITFEGVSFSYHAGDRTAPAALEGVSFHLAPGRYYALVGASGAGKSTVFALLQRFYDPSAGRIRLDGHDLRDLTQESLHAQIGVVTQDNFLFHETVADNIRYGRLEARDEEVYAAARLAHAEGFIRTLPHGYQTIIGDRGSRLSGGQAQRLAIARAVLKDAPVLLLDEATSALDSESERAIQEALETLAAGRTVIAIAHRLSTILKADEILVLDHGRLVERGHHADLLARPGGLYRRLYELQFSAHPGPENKAGRPPEDAPSRDRPLALR